MNEQSETLRQALAEICGTGIANPSTSATQRSMADHNASAWAEDFHRWALTRCVWHDRCFGGIGALHRDFCEWAIAHESPPCNRQTFERLLHEMGLLIADGLASGLVLREDFRGGGIVTS
jgi:hypothetical protein